MPEFKWVCQREKGKEKNCGEEKVRKLVDDRSDTAALTAVAVIVLVVIALIDVASASTTVAAAVDGGL